MTTLSSVKLTTFNQTDILILIDYLKENLIGLPHFWEMMIRTHECISHHENLDCLINKRYPAATPGVKDYLMQITHVIRGVGHLSNTPRQVLIYEALGYPLPKYAHASEIVGADGKKLSKRAGATSILAFRDLGYTAECFRNYMALLGWTSESGQEYLPHGELEKIFDVERCSKSPSLFDVFKKVKEEDKEKTDFNSLPLSALADQLNPKSKLNWLSNKYIRDSDITKLCAEVIPFIKDNKGIPEEIKNANNETLQSLLESIRVYLDRLSQAPDYISEFFNNDIVIENEDARTIATAGNAGLFHP
jgi:glutamyl-tRNA synthetase/nondiscriminating glutamyl-tRNA synthetase